jgi:hypothetical protein
MKVACVGIFEARQRKKKKREVEKGQQKLTRHSQECKQPFEKKKGAFFFSFVCLKCVCAHSLCPLHGAEHQRPPANDVTTIYHPHPPSARKKLRSEEVTRRRQKEKGK